MATEELAPVVAIEELAPVVPPLPDEAPAIAPPAPDVDAVSFLPTTTFGPQP